MMLGFDKVDTIERDFAGLRQTIPNTLTNYATHGLHYYPAKFIPQFPAFFISRFSKKGNLVVDPMCGAGTTLIESALQGRCFFGLDIDPIGTLISKVATSPLAGCETEHEFNHRVKQLLLRIWEKVRYSKSSEVAIPSEDDFPNAQLWFREDVLKELLLIRNVVLEEVGEPFRNFGKLCLSSIVRDVSNADPRDIFPQRDQKNPVRPRRDTLKEFENSVWNKFQKVVSFSKRVENRKCGEVKCADAREIPLEDNSAQLIFTSPPYAYAVDYARVQQLSTLLLFLQNKDFKEYRKRYVGTDRVSLRTEVGTYDGIEFAQGEIENILRADRKCGLVLHQYFKDMYLITEECWRILKPNGCLIYVVGNSTIKKTTFRTNEVFKSICESVGFHVERMLERPYYMYRMSRKRNTHSNTVKSDFFLIARKMR